MASWFGTSQQEEETIDCNPRVTHEKVNKYVNNCKKGCNNCRRVMQMARLTVTKEEGGFLFDALKNFELTCYCDHFTLRFWSGSKGNKIVVQMDPNTDKVSVETTHVTWSEYLEVVVKNAWDQFKDVIVTFSGETPRFVGELLAKLVWNPAPKG